MEESGAIREGDLLQLDGTIDKLIGMLTELGTSYGSLVETVKTGADSIAKSLKSVSGATREGRAAIGEGAEAADRLARMVKELSFAESEAGKQVAILKSQIRDTNKTTVEHHRALKAAVNSYESLVSDIKELTAVYKSLSEAERNDAAYGGEVLKELLEKKNAITALDAAMKPHIQQLTGVQKAERELAYWLSEEGKRELELRKQISEAKNGRKEEKVVIDEVTAARQRLEHTSSAENKQVIELNMQIDRHTKLMKLQAKVAAAQPGSYNHAAASYELAKFKLQELNPNLRENADEIKRLTDRAASHYAVMRKFQEGTGVFSLGVGTYKEAFTGLNFAVQQVVRELPSAAINLNTFFLAISNNIPMLTDELGRARAAYEQQKKAILESNIPLEEQKAAIAGLQKPITTVIKSVFSWQTAMVLALTVFSKWGGEIIKWIGNLFKGEKALTSFSDALKEVRKELKGSDQGFGKNMATVRRLRNEYLNLKTVAEKNKWVEDNKSEWQQLDVAIYNVNDAEKFFIQNTDNVNKAFALRAKAAASMKIVEDLYSKMLVLEEKRRSRQEEGAAGFASIAFVGSPTTGAAPTASPAELYEADQKAIQSEIEGLQERLDVYVQLAAEANDLAKQLVGEYDQDKFGKGGRGGLGGRDITKYIENTRVKVTKSADDAVAKQQQDDFNKRRAEALKNYKKEIGDLQNTLAENTRILDGYYKLKKGLTPEQKAALEQMNADILAALADHKLAYDETISDIFTDERIFWVKQEGNLIKTRLEGVRLGSEEEYELRKKAIENQKELELLENSKLIEDVRLNEEDITAKYDAQLEELEYKRQAALLDIKKEGIELRLDAEYLSLDRQENLELERIELERQAAILANRQLAENLRKDEDLINAHYDRIKERAEAQYELEAFRVGQTETRTLMAEAARSSVRTGVQVGQTGSRKRQAYGLDLELGDINKQLSLADKLDLSAQKVADLRARRQEVSEELDKITGVNGVFADIAANGPAGGILGALGFDDEAISGFNSAVDTILDGISTIMEAEVEAAEQALELQQERVDAARAAYDAELEARNNGYANSVETARKELEAERRKEAERQKLLEEAQKRQEAVDTITQTSSLITAAAQIWSSMSGIKVIGPALAGAAIAAMFASFAAAKIKAAQVTQQYGEGGLEFLEGGSHASGNDIDLGTRNGRGRNMRAEGGEALAVINRRNTAKYRKELPFIIESLNKGTFEDTYLNAFSDAKEPAFFMRASAPSVDLSSIEDDVRGIRRNSETMYYSRDGATVIQYKNRKRIIRYN